MLQTVGGAHGQPVALGQVEECKALMQVFLSPGGQLRVADLPVNERDLEQYLGLQARASPRCRHGSQMQHVA